MTSLTSARVESAWWRELLFWVVCVGGIVAGAALLTPAAHALALEQGWVSDAPHKHVAGFLKVFRRLLQVPLVVLVLWRLKPWRDGGLELYGLIGPRVRRRPIVAAFALTVGVGVLIVVLERWLGWLVAEPDASLERAWRPLGKHLLVGLGVGLLEELFFRGWMQRRLERRTSPLRAALWVAGIFAVLHAFKPSSLRASVEPSAAGALEALGQWVHSVLVPTTFGPTFLGLFLFSHVLRGAYVRSGTLWSAVAVHAAAVLVAYGHEQFTDMGSPPWWGGGRRLVDGAPALVLLAAAAWLLWPPAAGTTESKRELHSQ